MRNRDILFKGKRVDNNEWEIGYFYHNVEYNKSFIINDSESTEVHPDTVCHFVKDDLFEGDILISINHYEGRKPYYNYHVIQWSEKFNGWFAKNKDNLGQEDTNGDIQLWIYLKNTEFEKIGNIHD